MQARFSVRRAVDLNVDTLELDAAAVQHRPRDFRPAAWVQLAEQLPGPARLECVVYALDQVVRRLANEAAVVYGTRPRWPLGRIARLLLANPTSSRCAGEAVE